MQVETDSRLSLNTAVLKTENSNAKLKDDRIDDQVISAEKNLTDKKMTADTVSVDDEDKHNSDGKLSLLTSEKEELEALELKDAVETIASFMNISSRNVNFQQDDSSDKTIIKIFDSNTKELIKQFPSEEVLDIAKKIVELRQDVGAKTGILLDEKV